METIVLLSKQEMIELCQAHMQSVFQETGQMLAPVLPRLGADWSGWEKAEAEINTAAQRGDLEAVTTQCDSYLKRAAATVRKFAGDEARPVPPERRAA